MLIAPIQIVIRQWFSSLSLNKIFLFFNNQYLSGVNRLELFNIGFILILHQNRHHDKPWSPESVNGVYNVF